MLKNNYFQYAVTLAVICLAASGLLSVVFNMTHPRIIYQQTQEEQMSLKDVLPKADSFEPVKEADKVVYYKALDNKNKIVGYAFKAFKKGYSSDIVTMVGIDTNGVIDHIKILSQNETPGLGTRITEVIQKYTVWDILLKKAKVSKAVEQSWFQGQFNGKNVANLYGSVNTISGATISSRAVIDSIQVEAQKIMEKISHGQ